MQTKRFYFIFLLLSTMFLPGCTKKTDPDLVGTPGCTPPCWRGIQPGETHLDFATQLLSGMEKKGGGKLTIVSPAILEWKDNNGKSYNIYSAENVITRIVVPINSTNVGDAIALLGDPYNYVIDGIYQGGFSITLFYPQKGLAIVTGDRSQFRIIPSMRVQKVVFIGRTDLPGMIQTIYGDFGAKTVLSDTREWKGYGNISP